jgi:hypothetical protein
VAKFLGTRCTGASGIPRRSFSGGQQDPSEVTYVDLACKRRKQVVRRMREAELGEKAQKGIRKRLWLTGVLAMPSGSGGGAMASGSSSLAVIS